MTAVINQMPFLRTDQADTNLSRAVHLHGIISTAREAAARYRAAVLAHPDLAARLCGLYGYETPQMWTGYVPARTDGHGHYNDSPYRQHLARLVGEAVERGGDTRSYDTERLALVPESRLRAAWTEQRTTKDTGPDLFANETTGAF